MRKAKLVWSLRAGDNLRRIKSRIARDAPRTATRFIQRLRKHVDRLRLFPESGGVLEEDNPFRFRAIYLQDYCITYDYDGRAVTILSVRHGAQLSGTDE